MYTGEKKPYAPPTLTRLSWSCTTCVRRVRDGLERVVAACGNGCLPLHMRTKETHPNPLERESETKESKESNSNDKETSEMTDTEITFVQELVDALDGTCLHDWQLEAGAARGGIIATAADGSRFSLMLTAMLLPTVDGSKP